MSDIWSEALAEAYASAPLEDVILPTLELRHPSILQDGQPSAIRVVADYGQHMPEVDEQFYGWTLKLEDDAPLNPGEEVVFGACAFDFTLPAQQEGALPTVEITIDNVANLVMPHMDALIGTRATLEVTYREYLLSDKMTPQYILSGLSMSRIRSNLTRISGTSSFADLINRSFPNVVYRIADFPGLLA